MCYICSPSQQSPIHILADHTYPTTFKTNGIDRGLKVSRTQKPKPPGKMKEDPKNPGKYKVAFEQENGFVMQLDAQTFHLVEFHFHEASEHWVNEAQFPMELHIVFQNASGRAVLGVLLDLPKRGQPTSHEEVVVVDKLPSESRDEEPIELTVIEKAFELNPSKWLPKSDAIREYYRYEGSLTTPGFDENVSWLLFKSPIVLRKEDIALLRRYFGLPARNPQPTHRRYVLATA